ncbi:MerR family transcriptional regulator [Nocardioides sp. Arc9.136]|uniref:MerR family transcriptional regulator n=1 Tax=Nocardioides sp. Arc9.136 TaxID=2996826 RepID=UPI002666552E|nr:MerR family transcriptional regulator [Nocardioides sp. Arc9.136]WKN48124.1 MerR family transcriptional regulator [Nocardioides sp. Arc9.136]
MVHDTSSPSGETAPAGPAGAGEPGTDEVFVVEELARRTGVSVRSLRSYQSRRLLPPPHLRGRTGFYGPEHVERVRLVQQLRAAGLKLDGIARMLDRDTTADGQLLAFTEHARGMFSAPEPEVTTLADLVDRFRLQADDAGEVLATALRLGLVREAPDAADGEPQVEVVAPALLIAGEEAMRLLGLDAPGALDLLERLRRHADGVAKLYVELFVDRVWQPFVDAGKPAVAWPDVEQALDDLRQLATRALQSTFDLAMVTRVDRVLGERLLG